MDTMTYTTENEIIEIHFDHAGQGVVAIRCEDGCWDVRQVQYQPDTDTLAVGLRYGPGPDVFHPATGEKLVAVRGGNSFYAIVEAETPAEALAAFKEVFQEAK